MLFSAQLTRSLLRILFFFNTVRLHSGRISSVVKMIFSTYAEKNPCSVTVICSLFLLYISLSNIPRRKIRRQDRKAHTFTYFLFLQFLSCGRSLKNACWFATPRALTKANGFYRFVFAIIINGDHLSKLCPCLLFSNVFCGFLILSVVASYSYCYDRLNLTAVKGQKDVIKAHAD